MKTLVKDIHEIDKAIKIVCNEIDSLMQDENSIILCSSDNEIISLSSKLRALHFIEYPAGSIEKSIKKMLLDACFAAEISGPGATEPFLRLTSFCLKRSRQDCADFLTSFNSEISKFDEKIRNNMLGVTANNLWDVLRRLTHGTKEFEIVKSTIESIGLEGKIFISESSSDVTLVEILDGYNFVLDVIAKPYSIDAWYGNDVRCLVIDGMIETVAEIHSLLESANASKESLAIIARGFDPEVIKTISLNNDRGTLNVVLMKVPFDISSVNILNDVAVVCGSDVLSSEKGQLISAVKINDLSSCDKMIISQNNVNILNDSTSRNVATHASTLAITRDATNDSFIRNVYDTRLRSLVSRSAKISVPKSSAKKGLSIERLDFILRSLKSLMKLGYYERVKEEQPSYIDQCVFADTNALSIGAIKSSIEHALRFIDLLARTGCCVLSVIPKQNDNLG